MISNHYDSKMNTHPRFAWACEFTDLEILAITLLRDRIAQRGGDYYTLSGIYEIGKNITHEELIKKLEYQSRLNPEHNPFQELADAQGKWSDKTFGKGRFKEMRSIDISEHLQDESKELTEALVNYFDDKSMENKKKLEMEVADNFLLLIDVCNKVKISTDHLVHLGNTKLLINKTRKWGKPDERGVFKHIEE